MKKYQQPKIKKVVLDPEQAVLQVCKVGGQYFLVGFTRCMGIGGSFMLSPLCNLSVRGYIRNVSANSSEVAGMAS
jgi:hypothetical protein